jgi:ubiquinone/menaquinone biosynthesis C-methylase UbiE
MPLLDHFNLLAPYYERFIPLRHPDRIITYANLPVSGPLLDAGGGTGRVSRALTGLASPLIIADISIGMLHQAQGKGCLEAVCTITELLPFPSQAFDRVLMIDALHHVIDYRAAALELWRVLKPGGRIVIEEPDVRTPAVKVVALLEKLALMRSHFISPPRIATLFNYRSAKVRIELDGFNAWIVIDKRLELAG